MNFGSYGNKILIDYFRFVAAAVVLGVLALGYFTLIDARIAELRTSGFLERARVEAELAASQDHLKQVNESIAKFQRVLPPEKLATINSFLPTGTDFPGLVLAVDDIATSANLDLETIAVSLVSSGPAALPADSGAAAVSKAAGVAGVNILFQDVSISVSHGQSYETFKQFVGLLESSQRLFDVLSLSFDHPTQTEGALAEATYTVTVRTYYLPESP